MVPVYRGLEETRRCLQSVLAGGNAAACEVIVVDDAGPEAELCAWLAALAADGRISLYRNDRNQGFVATVNRAMSLHPDRDAVLLNSDTEVSGNWLDRLLACAATDPRIATVTPFSNNGSICSYPWPEVGGELPEGRDLTSMDTLFARANRGRCADLPTGVGFCLYIRRAAWAQLGPFDVARFGTGYGEECDFCRRAAKSGWRNVLAADVFVYHQGSVSFGAARSQRIQAAEQVMAELHPEYPRLVDEFVRADPLRPLRERVDLERAGEGGADARRLLATTVAEREELRRQLAGARRELERQEAQWRAETGRLRSALQDAQGFVRAREADVDELQQRCALLRRQLAELQARHEQVIHSRTWRYSRRLRRLLRLE